MVTKRKHSRGKTAAAAEPVRERADAYAAWVAQLRRGQPVSETALRHARSIGTAWPGTTAPCRHPERARAGTPSAFRLGWNGRAGRAGGRCLESDIRWLYRADPLRTHRLRVSFQ